MIQVIIYAYISVYFSWYYKNWSMKTKKHLIETECAINLLVGKKGSDGNKGRCQDVNNKSRSYLKLTKMIVPKASWCCLAWNEWVRWVGVGRQWGGLEGKLRWSYGLRLEKKRTVMMQVRDVKEK